MIERRGFFGALVGIVAAGHAPRPDNWKAAWTPVSVRVEAWSGDDIRAIVRSDKFVKDFVSAYTKKNSAVRDRQKPNSLPRRRDETS